MSATDARLILSAMRRAMFCEECGRDDLTPDEFAYGHDCEES